VPDCTEIRCRIGAFCTAGLLRPVQIHISADLAYAVWQYWHATGDDTFFLDAGAEILLETARFWASRAVAEADGMRHIRHVIGPDEYHEDVDDNAFTNVMARWNIVRALEAIDMLRTRWPERASALRDMLARRGRTHRHGFRSGDWALRAVCRLSHAGAN
jgi:trehalose/maltose hydrolase-like predicted phosphorylase